MLIDKTVKVEKELDDLMSQLVAVIIALKAGQPPGQVIMNEVMQLQALIADVQELPLDFAESVAGCVKSILCNATDLAVALVGKK